MIGRGTESLINQANLGGRGGEKYGNRICAGSYSIGAGKREERRGGGVKKKLMKWMKWGGK